MAARRTPPPLPAEKPDDGRPITVDPNLEDLTLVAIELKLAERLGKKWKRKFLKIPTAAYGVEWASTDPKTGALKGFVHFVHGKSDDDGVEVRLSRLLRGLQLSAASGVPFVVVAIRGKNTGFAQVTEDMLAGIEMYGSSFEGRQPEVFARLNESHIKIMK